MTGLVMRMLRRKPLGRGILMMTAMGSTVVGTVGSSSTAQAASSPLRILIVGTFHSSQGFQFPEAPKAAQAAVSALNKSGGVKGHQVNLIVCNDGSDPATAAACAQKAVSDHVVAVLGDSEYLGNAIVPVLQKAKIAFVGNTPSVPAEFTSPYSYPIGGGSPFNFAAVAVALGKQGCKRTQAVLLDPSVTILTEEFANAGLKSVGAPALVAAGIVPSLTETDYAPVAAALSGNNVDCVVNIADPEVTPALVTAIAQGGTKMVLGGVDAQFTPQIVQQLGSAANGDIYASQYYPPNGNHAGVVTFRAAMARYEPTASVTSVAEEAWAGVQYFTAAVKKISGSITSASFAKSIATLGEVNLGVTAPFNNETRNPIAAYNRVSDPHEFIAKIENGNAKELETVNVQPAVKLQSTGKGNIGS